MPRREHRGTPIAFRPTAKMKKALELQAFEERRGEAEVARNALEDYLIDRGKLAPRTPPK